MTSRKKKQLKFKYPEKLKFMGYEFDVKIASNEKIKEVFGGDNYYLGAIGQDEKTILLNEELDNQQTVDATLLHELIHLGDFILEVGLSEEQIIKLEHIFYTIIRQNDYFRNI